MDNIVLIDRDKIQISSGGKILNFPLAPTMVHDLEVVNREQINIEISNFLQKNQVVLAKTLVLLSESVCFITERSGIIQDFISALPFENPIAIELDGKYIGTNRDLYDAIVEAIGRKGATVKSVSPLFLTGALMGKRELTDEIIATVNANETVYSKGFFSFNIPPSPPLVVQTKAKNKKVTFILVGIFAFLAMILLAMIF